MKKLFAILLATAFSTSAFAAGTSYTCTGTLDNGSDDIVVQGSYSQTGALQSPVTVVIDGVFAERYSGVSGSASDMALQIDGNKNGNKLELRHFVVANGTDPKNYLEYSGKLNGRNVVYKTKNVSCARAAK